MSENEQNNINNQFNSNQMEENNLFLSKEGTFQSSYIKELKYSKGESRIIQITGFKGIYYIFLFFLILEIIEIIIAFTILRRISFLKWLLTLNLLPFIILFLFIPVKAICKFDYNNKIFTSYITPIIPIAYPFYSHKVDFNDISFFYFFKIKKLSKKYYKLGINKLNGDDCDIILGLDASCSTKYDPKLFLLPSIFKSFLME